MRRPPTASAGRRHSNIRTHCRQRRSACRTEKWGERPVLFVALRPESAASAGDILALYTGRVARWAVPHRVIILDSLPLGATGKVQKSKLREFAAVASTRPVRADCD